MMISDKIEIQDKKRLPANAKTNDGHFPADTFNWYLDMERQRSKRTKGTVCLLTIDLVKLSQSVRKTILDSIENKTLPRIIRLIQSNIRTSDLYSIIDSRFNILLSNTSEEGAYAASRRICKRLQADLKQHAFFSDHEQKVEVVVQTWNHRGNVKYKTVLFDNGLKTKIKPAQAPQSDAVLKDFKYLEQKIRRKGKNESWYFINLKMKRLLDIVLASIMLFVLAPVFLSIALAVKLTSTGPILFCQTRVGLNGKLFRFYKFRSMYQNSDDRAHRDYVTRLIKEQIEQPSGNGDTKIFKMQQDPRITGIGKILREWSLDELPQLLNVLKGDMSLVGPRPAIPYEVENYTPWHLQRLEVLPGITGLWQVSGRCRTTFTEMVRLDIQYIRNWNIWLDIKILFRTLNAVCKRDGAV